MDLKFEEAPGLWREDSAIWAIIAGEVLLQHDAPDAQNAPALIEVGASRAEEAAALMESDDLNAAGHATIGCAVSLALAARTQIAKETPVEAYASELAEALSWQASTPNSPTLIRLAEEIRAQAVPFLGESGPDTSGRGPTLWELALQTGGCAVGMSPHIIRRRERRDLVERYQ
jgi:hypothetical protein